MANARSGSLATILFLFVFPAALHEGRTFSAYVGAARPVHHFGPLSIWLEAKPLFFSHRRWQLLEENSGGKLKHIVCVKSR
ncbi:hypothetical protein XENOCAPTIV_001344 [Xenoophorus captivus]|uniref:Secreted protein n=1 Tax=Xenoophorus captivus TaxID=1517983 RepID=A0ABV0R683_9TELE